MPNYAENTTVSGERSVVEIQQTLLRYGARKIAHVIDIEQALSTFMFNFHDRMYRISVRMPALKEFQQSPVGRRRSSDSAMKAFNQACRQRMRALALVVKAKLEAVESGISDVETEFLPYLVLPNNQTIGAYLLPQIDDIYRTQGMPKLLMEG